MTTRGVGGEEGCVYVVDLHRNDVKDELDALELAHVIGVVNGITESGTCG